MLERVISFDKTQSSECRIEQPEKYNALYSLKAKKIIARGASLSYCNAAAASGGVVVDMRHFNRILKFEPEHDRITVEAGISIGELNNFLINEGYLLAVLPGYPAITVGGCIAFNVHGKAQYKVGTFKDWVEEISLYYPGKKELCCSASENEDLFDLTIGGMGLTGIILTATLRLKKIKGNELHVTTIKAKNLEESVAIMQKHSDAYDYVYSWNNFNLHGASFGKGLVFLEKVTQQMSTHARQKPFKNRLVSTKFPALWNDFTIPLMCRFFYLLNSIKKSHTVSLYQASFPIYGKEIYYYLFGKRGFREYQVIFPYDTWGAASEDLKKLLMGERTGIALGSVKLFRGKAHNISLSGEGVCVAIDVANTEKSIQLFAKLDTLTLANRGVINLSKDSRVDGELAAKIFTNYTNFKNRLHSHDSEKLFFSDLREQLAL